MMGRAIGVSLLLHLALLSAVYFFGQRSPSPTLSPDLVVQAPLGDVFVHEQSSVDPPPTPAPENEGSLSAPPETQSAGIPGLPDGEAQPLGTIQPEYPPLSRKLGEEGEAVFLLEIDDKGQVTSARLEKSSGFARLDEGAEKSLLGARFQPAAKAGVAAASTKRFRIEFKLNAQ